MWLFSYQRIQQQNKNEWIEILFQKPIWVKVELLNKYVRNLNPCSTDIINFNIFSMIISIKFFLIEEAFWLSSFVHSLKMWKFLDNLTDPMENRLLLSNVGYKMRILIFTFFNTRFSTVEVVSQTHLANAHLNKPISVR